MTATNNPFPLDNICNTHNYICIMHTLSPLDALFPRIRQITLSTMVLQPDRWWYLSDLAHHLHVTPASLQRDLAALTKAGILHKRKDGNRIYYKPDPDCSFLPDLQGLFVKTMGLPIILNDAMSQFEDSIEFAFIYGSIAAGNYISTSDVDLMIIGSIRLAELAVTLGVVEQKLKRSVNPTIYTHEEFQENLTEGQHFLTSVMQKEKLFLKGKEDELVKTHSKAAGAGSLHKPT